MPESGTPLSVEGIEIRPLMVAVGVGLGVAVMLGVTEGVSVADGVEAKEGKSLSPAARTVKSRLID